MAKVWLFDIDSSGKFGENVSCVKQRNSYVVQCLRGPLH